MITHLGCIMDGNRRWAKKQGIRSWLGHQEGVEAAKRTIGFCLDNKIKYLTLYAFSIENFKRSSAELHFLFKLFAQQMSKQSDEFIEKGIRVQFVGERTLFPPHLVSVCQDLEEKTKHLDQLYLSVLFCYGGQQEIVTAVKDVIKQVQDKTVALEEICKETFEQFLWMGNIPKPDLIIRTGGIRRLSNFLLYHAAYSELFFLDHLWPELTTNHLQEVLSEYTKIQRNFGQ